MLEEGSDMDLKKTFIGLFTTRVKRWNLSIAQSKSIWRAGSNREDDTDGLTLYSFQTFTFHVL